MRLHHPKGEPVRNWPKTLEINYSPSDWDMDENGYFLIDINRIEKRLLIGFCSPEGTPLWKISGEHPIPLYYTIIKYGALSKLEHAAYLGEELEKAYLAMRHGLDYVQDEELDLNAKYTPSEKDAHLEEF